MTAAPADPASRAGGEAGPGVAVCVPVLNERDVLGGVLTEISRQLEGLAHSVCLVDDGSTDGTLELIESTAPDDPGRHLLRHEKPGPGCQRGAASRAGLEWLLANTAHDVFVDIDADGSQRPEELRRGVRHVWDLGYDVVVASRYVHGSRVLGRPLTRRLASRAYNLAARSLLDPSIRDYSNSYRFYSRRAAEAIAGFEPAFTTPLYLLEMMARWVSLGFTILEIPCVYDSRRGGASKVGVSNAVEALWGTFSIGLKARLGLYGRGPIEPSRGDRLTGAGSPRGGPGGAA